MTFFLCLFIYLLLYFLDKTTWKTSLCGELIIRHTESTIFSPLFTTSNKKKKTLLGVDALLDLTHICIAVKSKNSGNTWSRVWSPPREWYRHPLWHPHIIFLHTAVREVGEEDGLWFSLIFSFQLTSQNVGAPLVFSCLSYCVYMSVVELPPTSPPPPRPHLHPPPRPSTHSQWWIGPGSQQATGHQAAGSVCVYGNLFLQNLFVWLIEWMACHHGQGL